VSVCEPFTVTVTIRPTTAFRESGIQIDLDVVGAVPPELDLDAWKLDLVESLAARLDCNGCGLWLPMGEEGVA
jgi:hypothetical protein